MEKPRAMEKVRANGTDDGYVMGILQRAVWQDHGSW